MKKIVKRTAVIVILISICLLSAFRNETYAYGSDSWGIGTRCTLKYANLCNSKNVVCVSHGGSLNRKTPNNAYKVHGILTIGKYAGRNGTANSASFVTKKKATVNVGDNDYNAQMALWAYYASHNAHPYKSYGMKTHYDNGAHQGAVQILAWASAGCNGYKAWWNNVGKNLFKKGNGYGTSHRENFAPRNEESISKESVDRLRTDMITYSQYIRTYNSLYSKQKAGVKISTTEMKKVKIGNVWCYGPFKASFPQVHCTGKTAYKSKGKKLDWSRVMGRPMVSVRYGNSGSWTFINTLYDAQGHKVTLYDQGRNEGKNGNAIYRITSNEEFYIPASKLNESTIAKNKNMQIRVMMDTPNYGGRILFMYPGSWQNLLLVFGNANGIYADKTIKLASQVTIQKGSVTVEHITTDGQHLNTTSDGRHIDNVTYVKKDVDAGTEYTTNWEEFDGYEADALAANSAPDDGKVEGNKTLKVIYVYKKLGEESKFGTLIVKYITKDGENLTNPIGYVNQEGILVKPTDGSQTNPYYVPPPPPPPPDDSGGDDNGEGTGNETGGTGESPGGNTGGGTEENTIDDTNGVTAESPNDNTLGESGDGTGDDTTGEEEYDPITDKGTATTIPNAIYIKYNEPIKIEQNGQQVPNTYFTYQLEFEDYTLIGLTEDSALPEGSLEGGVHEVVYQYESNVTYVEDAPTGSVFVEYVTIDGDDLEDSYAIKDNEPIKIIKNGVEVNNTYTTVRKDFSGYRYVSLKEGSAPTSGDMIEGELTVTYVYEPLPDDDIPINPRDPSEPEITLSIRKTIDDLDLDRNTLYKYNPLASNGRQYFVIKVDTPKLEAMNNKGFKTYKLEFSLSDKLALDRNNFYGKVISYGGDDNFQSVLRDNINYTVENGKVTIELKSRVFKMPDLSNSEVNIYGTTIEIYVPIKANATATNVATTTYLVYKKEN